MELDDEHRGLVRSMDFAQCIICGEVMHGVIMGDDKQNREKCYECEDGE